MFVKSNFTKLSIHIFITDYDSNSQLIKWSNSNIDKIFKLLKKYNKLQSNKNLALRKINKRKIEKML